MRWEAGDPDNRVRNTPECYRTVGCERQHDCDLSGDIHSSWVHDIKADFDNPTSATIRVEFVGTSISSSFPIALVPAIARAVPESPHTRLFDGRYRGHVRCTVTPHYWRTDYRAVPTVFTDAADAFTLASFVVLDGQPGAIPA